MVLPNKPRILASTYNPVSKTRMVSFLVDFPTVLLAELRTHRILTQGSLYEHMELDDFNMSANSARAIPHNRYLQKVVENPFVPIWTKQQKGMSGNLLEDKQHLWEINQIYLNAKDDALKWSDYISGYKVHKANINRLLAPFAYTTCIISGTEWDNFFELRCPKYVSDNIVAKSQKEYSRLAVELNETYPSDYEDWQSINHSSAQPEFQIIAEMLYDLYQEADWKESKYHIPFKEDIDRLYHKEISKQDTFEEGMNLAMKISASMCAKLSYNTQDNEDSLEKHLERANHLIESKHYEPFSHQSIAMSREEYQFFQRHYLIKRGKYNDSNAQSFKLLSLAREDGLVGAIEYGHCWNLRGFISQRYVIENL